MIAVRFEDVAPPLRNGALPGAGGVSALVVASGKRAVGLRASISSEANRTIQVLIMLDFCLSVG